MADHVDDAVRAHLSAAGKLGGKARWAGSTPEERRSKMQAANKARGLVADAIALAIAAQTRVDELETELLAMAERLATLEQQQIAA